MNAHIIALYIITGLNLLCLIIFIASNNDLEYTLHDYIQKLGLAILELQVKTGLKSKSLSSKEE